MKTRPNWGDIIMFKALVYSPNLVWLLIAAVDYWALPYDMNAARQLSMSFMTQRVLANTGIMISYFGFWHVVLYGLGWAKRPFLASRSYRWSKLVHNMWWSLLGAWQWAVWEVVFVHCYATGKLPSPPAELTWRCCLNTAVWCAAVPVYRNVHFYFAHRFEHVKCFYNLIHSLHHRNTDVEPFSGLAMHPIEHLYYFSCAFIVLYAPGAPLFAFKWLGVHALISPAASHSGWEDHFQSDQFHYLHHKFFEVNPTRTRVLDPIATHALARRAVQLWQRRPSA